MAAAVAADNIASDPFLSVGLHSTSRQGQLSQCFYMHLIIIIWFQFLDIPLLVIVDGLHKFNICSCAPLLISTFELSILQHY